MKELVLGSTRVAVVVQFDRSGRATKISWPCKDTRCCPPRDGLVAIHSREILGLPDLVGPERKEYQPRKSAKEMARGRPPG